MKKALLILISLSWLNAVAQKDSIRVKADTSYAVILSKTELQWLMQVIEKQDEKPSIIKAQVQAIYQKVQMILPNKEKPKK